MLLAVLLMMSAMQHWMQLKAFQTRRLAKTSAFAAVCYDAGVCPDLHGLLQGWKLLRWLGPVGAACKYTV